MMKVGEVRISGLWKWQPESVYVAWYLRVLESLKMLFNILGERRRHSPSRPQSGSKIELWSLRES
jgi:hypothetical protein